MRRLASVLSLALLVGASALTYPVPPKDNTVTDYFGVKVPDPYRPLEQIDSPQTRAWVRAEGALTRRYLDAIPQRAAIARHLKAIVDYERFSAPWHVKRHYFYTYNSGLQNQDVLYTMDGPHGTPRVLIDPNRLSADGTVALGGTDPSWNGALLAYATQSSGSDWQTWRVRDVRTGRDLPDVLRWSKFSTAAWLPDNRAFLYERYPQPAGGLAYKGALYGEAIYLHRLDTPQSSDTRFYANPAHKDWIYYALVTNDGRYAVLTIDSGASVNTRIGYVDLRDPRRRLHELLWKNDAQYTFVDNAGSTFFVQSTKSAPNGDVLAIDVNAPQRVRVLIPQGHNAIQSVATAGLRMFVTYLADAHVAVDIYDLHGHFVRSVPLPGLGMAEGFGGWPDDTTVYYTYSGYTMPPTTYAYDIASGRSTVYRKPKIAFDASRYTTIEIFYRSKDGTRVPMMISYRKGLARNGENPTILYGYGGFDIAMTPYFSTLIASWLQMGGVYAVANIRGGSEYGEAWHRAGMRANKQNVFNDFIAAAQYLIANRYTSTPKLAAKGESNGGLLIGAMETQRPDLWGAALPGVGVMDMLRFDKFTIGNAWIPEYGCATCSKAQFETLYRYSPYENIRPGTHYPPTLVMTADHDDRVFPAHSFKFAAAMQVDQAGSAPILLRIESKAGHGGGAPIAKMIDEYTDIYAFLVKNLHMTLPRGY